MDRVKKYICFVIGFLVVAFLYNHIMEVGTTLGDGKKILYRIKLLNKKIDNLVIQSKQSSQDTKNIKS